LHGVVTSLFPAHGRARAAAALPPWWVNSCPDNYLTVKYIRSKVSRQVRETVAAETLVRAGHLVFNLPITDGRRSH
jgi:hypothetical protein